MQSEDEEIKAEYEAARHFVERLSCILFIDTGKWLHAIGSGTLIQIKSRLFIATAAHVIRDCNPGQIKIGSTLIVHYFFRVLHLGVFGGRDEDKADVAWIEVEIPAEYEIENIINETNPFLEDLTIEDPVIVSGYPDRDVKYSEVNKVFTTSASHFGYITGIVEDAKWDNAFDKKYHILLEYNRQMRLGLTEFTEAPPAWGLSGGGIWMNDKKQRKLRLAGIQISWDGPKEILHGIKIENWMGYLFGSHFEFKNKIQVIGH
jgi:hypothetical protein